MTFPVRVATAFRWRTNHDVGVGADVTRVRNDDGVPVAALANGFLSAFDACAPSASRLLLDLFFAEWAASSAPVQDRLGIAFEAARQRFLAEAQGLFEPDIDFDFPDTRPAGVLLAVAIDGATAHAAWIGGDEAILARGGLVAGASMPHTFLRQLDPEARGDLPNILTRSIGLGPQGPAERAAFELMDDDKIILISKLRERSPGLSTYDVARAAAEHGDPAILAEHLAERRFADGDAPYAAVAILRVGR